MATLTRDDVLKLAHLAKIDLSEDEVEMFVVEFNAILGYVDQLKSVDVTGLLPTSQVTGLTNVMREDVERGYGYEPRDMLQNAPQVKDDQLQVKRMIN